MERREFDWLRELGRNLVGEVGRLADANEMIVKLASDQQENMNAPQPGPPFCPHCGTFDPAVEQYQAGSGKMSEFVLAAKCDRCGETLYGVVEGWQVAKSPEEALSIMEGREDDDVS